MHVIRLRRPWEKSCDGGSLWTRIDVPEIESPAERPPEDTGHASLYRRRFNLPTGLQAKSRVLLRVEAWDGQLESVLVNDSVVAIGAGSLEADVTDLLSPHNQVLVHLRSSEGRSPRLTGEVSLAIHED